MSSETLYIILFIATFPALWLLAYLMDRFLPEQKTYSPRAEREREQQNLLSQGQETVDE
jgi:hypothetical protein